VRDRLRADADGRGDRERRLHPPEQAYYGGCPGTTTLQTTWSLCNAQWESAQQTNGIDVPLNALASIDPTSATVSLTIVCPMPNAATYGYDATPTTLALHVPVDSYVRVDTFTLMQ
jgi:hypothetical protein